MSIASARTRIWNVLQPASLPVARVLRNDPVGSHHQTDSEFLRHPMKAMAGLPVLQGLRLLGKSARGKLNG